MSLRPGDPHDDDRAVEIAAGPEARDHRTAPGALTEYQTIPRGVGLHDGDGSFLETVAPLVFPSTVVGTDEIVVAPASVALLALGRMRPR